MPGWHAQCYRGRTLRRLYGAFNRWSWEQTRLCLSFLLPPPQGKERSLHLQPLPPCPFRRTALSFPAPAFSHRLRDVRLSSFVSVPKSLHLTQPQQDYLLLSETTVLHIWGAQAVEIRFPGPHIWYCNSGAHTGGERKFSPENEHKDPYTLSLRSWSGSKSQRVAKRVARSRRNSRSRR